MEKALPAAGPGQLPAEHWRSKQPLEAGTADAAPAPASSCVRWTHHTPFEDYSALKSCFGHTEPQSTPDPESYRLVMRPSCSAFWKLLLKTYTPKTCWRRIHAHISTWNTVLRTQPAVHTDMEITEASYALHGHRTPTTANIRNVITC